MVQAITCRRRLCSIEIPTIKMEFNLSGSDYRKVGLLCNVA